jgi:hypothetical protein
MSGMTPTAKVLTAAGFGGLGLDLGFSLLCYRLLIRREHADTSSFDRGYDAGYDDRTRELDPSPRPATKPCRVIPLHPKTS